MNSDNMIKECEEIINKGVFLKIEVGKFYDKYLVDIISNGNSKTLYNEDLLNTIDEVEKFIIENLNEIRRNNNGKDM
ncbi:MAG: hypothetical protein AABY22_04425 [Nanoarchaeota archaeon]